MFFSGSHKLKRRYLIRLAPRNVLQKVGNAGLVLTVPFCWTRPPSGGDFWALQCVANASPQHSVCVRPHFKYHTELLFQHYIIPAFPGFHSTRSLYLTYYLIYVVCMEYIILQTNMKSIIKNKALFERFVFINRNTD